MWGTFNFLLLTSSSTDNTDNLAQFRSSRRRCSVKKGVLKKFAKFTRKHLCQILFFNKVVGLRPAILLKKRLWHRYFPENLAKFLRTPFLQNTSGGCFCPFKLFTITELGTGNTGNRFYRYLIGVGEIKMKVLRKGLAQS